MEEKFVISDIEDLRNTLQKILYKKKLLYLYIAKNKISIIDHNRITVIKYLNIK